MSDAAKVANVKHELALLEKTWRDSGAAAGDIGPEEANLTRVNEALWVIEDDIRDEERAGRFGQKFIELARAVYVTNDERAAIKKRINSRSARTSSKKSPTSRTLAAHADPADAGSWPSARPPPHCAALRAARICSRPAAGASNPSPATSSPSRARNTWRVSRRPSGSWRNTTSARCSSSPAPRWSTSPACTGGAASASPPPCCRAKANSRSSRRISKSPRCAKA